MYVTNTLCIRPTRYEYAKNFFLKTSKFQRTPTFYIHFYTLPLLAKTSRCDSALTSRCPRIRAPKLEHAAWKNGARPPFVADLTHALSRVLALRNVDGTRPLDRRWVSADFSQGPAYKSRPGLFTRQGQIEVPGSAGGSTNVSSREVSKDGGSAARRRLNLSITSS